VKKRWLVGIKEERADFTNGRKKMGESALTKHFVWGEKKSASYRPTQYQNGKKGT